MAIACKGLSTGVCVDPYCISNGCQVMTALPNGMIIGSCSICNCPTVNGGCVNGGCRSHFTKTLQPWGFPTPIAAMVDDKPPTLEDWKKKQWDAAMAKADLLTKREAKMVYYYLNKQGVTMANLDHDIDRDLNKQYASEHPKKAW